MTPFLTLEFMSRRLTSLISEVYPMGLHQAGSPWKSLFLKAVKIVAGISLFILAQMPGISLFISHSLVETS